jgi:hypothetical protein
MDKGNKDSGGYSCCCVVVLFACCISTLSKKSEVQTKLNFGRSECEILDFSRVRLCDCIQSHVHLISSKMYESVLIQQNVKLIVAAFKSQSLESKSLADSYIAEHDEHRVIFTMTIFIVS